MADSSTDKEVITVAISCVYWENISYEKWYSLVLKVWLGKVHEEDERRFQARRGEAEVLYIQSDSKDLRDFAWLPTPFNRRF